MRNLLFIFLLSIPLFSFSQKNTWHLGIESGVNVSFNRMTAIDGNDELLNNKKELGGYWGVNAAYQFTARTAFTFGFDNAAYKKSYEYGLERGPSVSSLSKIYVWGVPLGIENYWLVDRKFEITTGYGIKYRFNSVRNFNGIGSSSSSSVLDNNNNVIEEFQTQEFAYNGNDHNLAIYLNAQFIYKIKPFLHLGLKVSYNQGLTTNESFQFIAKHDYPLENRTEENEFLYESKLSCFSTGLSLKYLFIKK